MKTSGKNSNSALQRILIAISVCSIVPLIIFGERWPWLAAFPLGASILFTVYFEVNRLRVREVNPNNCSRPEVKLDSGIFVVFGTAVARGYTDVPDRTEWIRVARSEAPVDYCRHPSDAIDDTEWQSSHERLATVA